MIVGIISYLPDNEDVRQQRLKYHKKQLELLLKLNCNIYIVAQNYRDTDFIINSNIYYFKYDSGIGPSQARNCLLNYFYSSDHDFMLCCDDDAYFYDYYNIFDFFNELNMNTQKFNELDYIRGICANKVPFKKTVYEDKNTLDKYVFEDRDTIGTTFIGIIRNLNKYYNKQIYYETMDVSNGGGYEDKDFCCKLKLNGIKTHVLKTFITSSYNYTDYSTLFSTYEDRMKVHNENNTYIDNKYKQTDLFVQGKLNKKYKDPKLMIPRDVSINIPDNLIPKYDVKITGKLF